MSDYYDDEIEIEIEGYCMSCRETVEIENPQAVWTKRGQAATRGECSMCGGTVFRMGKTDLHDFDNQPEPVIVGEESKRGRPKLSRDTVYLNYAAPDESFAQRLADDLQKSGVAVWLHELQENVNWSGGVHPALTECDNMVLVLSSETGQAADVAAAWQHFRGQRKPVYIAQTEAVEPPDPLRRSPRYDFNADYKSALRQMVNEISA